MTCFLVSTASADFQRTKIAVLDFEIIGEKLDTVGMGAILSEWFITSIVQSGRFDVVERAMLQKIITEQKLSTTGLIDSSSASELGKILGVEVIISGSMLRIRDTIEINSRVISVQNGSIIAAESIRGAASGDYHNLVERLTKKIMRNFPLTGYIVKKDDKTALIDLGLGSGLTSGTDFIVFREGEIIKHPKTGEVLDVEQIITGRLSITKVNRKFAIGKIITEEGDGIQYGQLVKSVTNSFDSKPTSTAAKIKKAPRKKEQSFPAKTPPPPVVSLKQDKKKVRAAPESVTAKKDSSSIAKSSPSSFASPSVTAKAGPKNHVAVYPSNLDWDADSISWTIDAQLPQMVEASLESLDRQRTYTLTNLHKEKSLQRSGWGKFKPNRDKIVNHARQKGIDFVVMYYFSFREGQGLINGWGTDFMSPTFKVFLVDVNKGTMAMKEDSDTEALDQLFIELKTMTRQLIRKTSFPN